jgi:hydroxypyruvate isomerase
MTGRPLSRRDLIAGAAGLSAISAMATPAGAAPNPAASSAAALAASAAAGPASTPRDVHARQATYRQSVCRWPFARIPLPDFCRDVAALGLEAIDLLAPEEWAIAAEHGLTCSLGYAAVRRDFIANGLSDARAHPLILGELEQALPLAASSGVPALIAMFGNRAGRSDAAATANCVSALRTIAPLAEEHGVTICIELLNSKVDHADYIGDRTAFGVRVIEEVASPRVKLLYDIYHMQVMEGDVIRTIRDNIDHIAHFHTAGNPGRHELDDRQELNYRGIGAALAELGFGGYIAHEFIPTGDPMAGLGAAVRILQL